MRCCSNFASRVTLSREATRMGIGMGMSPLYTRHKNQCFDLYKHQSGNDSVYVPVVGDNPSTKDER